MNCIHGMPVVCMPVTVDVSIRLMSEQANNHTTWSDHRQQTR